MLYHPRLSAIVICSALLAACGGGGSPADTGSDAASGSDDTTTPTPAPSPAPEPGPGPAPSPDPAPAPSPEDPVSSTAIILSSSEGAADGLVGCLNKGLYTFGEVERLTAYKQTNDNKSSPITVQYFTSRMLFQAQDTLLAGTYHRQTVGGTSYERMRMVGDSLYQQGTTRFGSYLAHPQPLVSYFDLEEGQTRQNQYSIYDGQTNPDSSPRLLTRTENQTYVGRQTVTVPAGTFETCRVNVMPASDFLDSGWHLWYAVGSGVLVKGINFQTAGRREGAPVMTFTRELTSASFGSTQVRP